MLPCQATHAQHRTTQCFLIHVLNLSLQPATKNPNPGIYSTAGNTHPGHSPFQLQHTTLDVYSPLTFLMILMMLFLSLSPAGIAFASHSYGLKPSLQKQISSPIQNKQTEHLSSLLVSS